MNDVNTNNTAPNTVEGNNPVTPQVTPETNQPAVPQNNVPEAGKPAGEENPTAPISKPRESKPAERTVPYSRLQEVVRKLRETERKQAQGPLGKYDQNDISSLREHPYVQEMELRIAEGEIKRGAEEILERFPNIPQQIRKAILRNPRGYVRPDTTDVQTALLDIEEYVDEIYGDFDSDANQPKPKDFPVAGQNAPSATQGSANPADLQRIYAKPLEDWTDQDKKLISDAARARGIRLLNS